MPIVVAGPSQQDGASMSMQAKSRDGYPAKLGTCCYRMIISYDGSAYKGWQLQPRAPTIQAVIEHALSTILREPREKLGVGAAGRTDAGVHARGQVVQFYSDHPELHTQRLGYRLNALLPVDVRVVDVRRTAPDFNVTCSARAKTYRYMIDLGEEHDPCAFRHRMHHPKPLDLETMRLAAAVLVGTHDFTQFSNNGEDLRKRNPVKTLTKLDLIQQGRDLILEVQGSGFLYKMVRHLTGALVAVGEGKLSVGEISRRLELGGSQMPGLGGKYRGYNVAPAKGLFMWEVSYPPEVDDPDRLLYPHLPHDEYGRLLDTLSDEEANWE